MTIHAQIRYANRLDLVYLSDIEQAAGRLFPHDRLPEPNATCPPELLENAMSEGLLFVAEVCEEVIGFACCQVEHNYLHLQEVSVHPNSGRRGIGAALLKRVFSEAVSRKLAGVSLTTFADFPWNAPFYRRLGFETPDATNAPRHIQSRLNAEEAAGMTKRIGMICQNPDSPGQ